MENNKIELTQEDIDMSGYILSILKCRKIYLTRSALIK
jgi:hypothetical protein